MNAPSWRVRPGRCQGRLRGAQCGPSPPFALVRQAEWIGCEARASSKARRPLSFSEARPAHAHAPASERSAVRWAPVRREACSTNVVACGCAVVEVENARAAAVAGASRAAASGTWTTGRTDATGRWSNNAGAVVNYSSPQQVRARGEADGIEAGGTEAGGPHGRQIPMV